MPQLGEKKAFGAGSVDGYWDGSKYVPKEVWDNSSKNPANSTSSANSSTYSNENQKNTIRFSKPNINYNTALRYPEDASVSNDSDYVAFNFFKYDPPFGKGQGGDGSVNLNGGNPGYNLYTQSGIGKKQTLASIILYMPEDIHAQYSGRWAGAGFGSLAAGALRVVGTDMSADAAGAALASAGGVLKTASYKGITDAINNSLNSQVSLNQVMGGVSGTVLNPNVEMMYEAPDLRGFDLSFKMTPTSNKEAKNIRQICNRFKKAMLPSFGGQAIFGIQKDSPNLLTIPNLCQVGFMQGAELHPYLPQYKLCAITDVSINYTPDGSYATYNDGSPVATQLKVTFRETKIIFADEINEQSASY